MNPEFITICGSIYRKAAIDAVFVQRVADENYAVHVVCNGVDSVCQSFRFFEDANELRNAITKEVLIFRLKIQAPEEVYKMVKTTELPLTQYMESTLNDVKTIINEMSGSEDDKKHILDTIWLLANSAKAGCDWTVDFGFPTAKE